MENDEIYVLMMEALDGELSEASRLELEMHLHAQPDLWREWRALQAVDTLFKTTPALSPAADFTQRTLARLPHSRQRLWFLGLVYVCLLLAGLVPAGIMVWLVVQVGPILFRPELIRSLLEAGSNLLHLVQIVLNALINSLGSLIGQQPAILGWLLVMAGMVFIWNGVYRQMVTPQPAGLLMER